MKWDRTFAKDAAVYRDVVAPILAASFVNERELEAQRLVREWDGTASESSVTATVVLLAWRRVPKGATPAQAVAALPATSLWLQETFGTQRVRWGDVQRLRHGDVDLPLGGANDVINAAVAYDAWDGKLVGRQGDSYILEVEFSDAGVTSRSVHQYGASV